MRKVIEYHVEMRKAVVSAVVFALGSIAALEADGQSPVKSFEEFRAGVRGDYNSFRRSVLADYDKFLDGVWADYEVFKGASRSNKPKPATLPHAEPSQPPVAIPAPEPVKSPMAPSLPEGAAKPSAPTAVPAPAVPEALSPTDVQIDFYGVRTLAPAPSLKLMNPQQPGDFAGQWRALSQSASAASLVKRLKNIAQVYGLNDYLTYELVAAYVNQAYSGASQTARHSLAHFLLANMGYNVRIALTGNDRAVLLMAMDGMVYARPYLDLSGNGGTTRYHLFELGQPDGTKTPASRISTCTIPDGTDCGRLLGLRINGLNLPANDAPFSLEGEGLKVSGTTNASLRALLYRYPQMAMGDYAASEVLPGVRRTIVNQLKAQLDTLPEKEAVDKLLKFCQQVTAYATDEVNHGFEKPYFLEEMLIYGKSDCEDRAIMYTYLLHNVLGVENQLIAYPGHESAAVCLSDEIKGDSYEYKGRRFYISDPTFIGASTGMCMPNYKSTKPQIDYHYQK